MKPWKNKLIRLRSHTLLMKNLLLCALGALLSFSLNAQTGVEVIYQQSYYPQQPVVAYFKLRANAKQSAYRLLQQADTLTTNITKTDKNYVITTAQHFKRYDTYTTFAANEIRLLVQTASTTKQINDFTRQLHWNITKTSKSIGDYLAIKATTEFRGRHYTAWFTPTIPIPAGPWKFSGLPGLILSIKDDSGTYSWQAIKVSYPLTVEASSVTLNPDIAEQQLTLQAYYTHKINASQKREQISRARAASMNAEIVDSQSSRRSKWLEKEFEWE